MASLYPTVPTFLSTMPEGPTHRFASGLCPKGLDHIILDERYRRRIYRRQEQGCLPCFRQRVRTSLFLGKLSHVELYTTRQSGEALGNDGDRTDLHLWYGGDALVSTSHNAAGSNVLMGCALDQHCCRCLL